MRFACKGLWRLKNLLTEESGRNQQNSGERKQKTSDNIHIAHPTSGD
jgi:ribosomal protein S6E (S10)